MGYLPESPRMPPSIAYAASRARRSPGQVDRYAYPAGGSRGVVAMGGSLGARPAVRGPSRAEQAPEASVLSRIPISVITLLAAIGVLVSSVAYGIGRNGDGGSSGSGVALYWIGQVIIIVP